MHNSVWRLGGSRRRAYSAASARFDGRFRSASPGRENRERTNKKGKDHPSLPPVPPLRYS